MEPTLQRHNLGKFCTAFELAALLSLQKTITEANAAALPVNLPQDISEAKLQKFLVKTLSRKHTAILKRQNWWRKCLKKYQLPARASVDTTTGEFFWTGTVYNAVA